MIHALEPAINPTARPTFLLDWELTMKCNLDCSYCPTTGITPGHIREAEHPPLDQCLETIDFMYEYVDLYMSKKPKWNRAVVLNVYGGESLFHPDIDIILEEVRKRHEDYKHKWPLTVTCTTNGVVGTKLMSKVVDLIDEFTVSYHCESLPKQKKLVSENLAFIKNKGKKLKCIVLMHGNHEHWPELLEVIDFCKINDISYLPRQLDGNVNSDYNQQQIIWFKNLWQKRTPEKSKSHQETLVDGQITDTMLSKVGRACCGGRLMCADQNLKQPVFYIPSNRFTGWSCSVNWFFLFIKQHERKVFVNKDCQMNFQGSVGPLGYLDDWKDIVEDTKKRLQNGIPSMTCAKKQCMCGLCAPKAQTHDEFLSVMKKYVDNNIEISRK